MFSFIGDHLDPKSRMGEVLFGLIMAMGFTGAVHLGHAEPDNRVLFVGILGCNLSWAVVDGVMYVVSSLFERNRKLRLRRHVLAASSDDEALRAIGAEIDPPLRSLTTPDELARIRREVLARLRCSPPETPTVHRDDVFGGIAVALLIAGSTLPIVVPYLVIEDPVAAVRVSHGVGLTSLFVLGSWWGRVVGAPPFAVGLGLTGVGTALVLLTIAMGG